MMILGKGILVNAVVKREKYIVVDGMAVDYIPYKVPEYRKLMTAYGREVHKIHDFVDGKIKSRPEEGGEATDWKRIKNNPDYQHIKPFMICR